MEKKDLLKYNKERIKIQELDDIVILTISGKYKPVQQTQKSKSILNNISQSLLVSLGTIVIGVIILLSMKANFVFFPLLIFLSIIFGLSIPILKEVNRYNVKIMIDRENIYVPKQISSLALKDIKDIVIDKKQFGNNYNLIINLLSRREGVKNTIYINKVSSDEADNIVEFIKSNVDKRKY